MRKDMDLDIEEKIKVKMEGIEFNEEGLKSIEKEVRGTFEEFECDNIQEWSIKTPNGEVYNLNIGIKKNM
jgi:isoleucyl-tRNA synthetase